MIFFRKVFQMLASKFRIVRIIWNFMINLRVSIQRYPNRHPLFCLFAGISWVLRQIKLQFNGLFGSTACTGSKQMYMQLCAKRLATILGLTVNRKYTEKLQWRFFSFIQRSLQGNLLKQFTYFLTVFYSKKCHSRIIFSFCSDRRFSSD